MKELTFNDTLETLTNELSEKNQYAVQQFVLAKLHNSFNKNKLEEDVNELAKLRNDLMAAITSEDFRNLITSMDAKFIAPERKELMLKLLVG